ncbi:ribbon-helix-helix protein, CopG family [Pyrococcus kukulkanii]|uniref:ribbon-helix-helix protein, CopG family n=1 Tax=Pyrococcus kukulkanii TaxID=1609559 RepID=UPI000F2C001B|nr:MAG: hypothetical protein DRN82_03220 [Thermococci archaeon]
MSRKVQIEVDEDLYNMLRIIALKKKVSLEEIIKEALENYVELENRRIRGEVKERFHLEDNWERNAGSRCESRRSLGTR